MKHSVILIIILFIFPVYAFSQIQADTIQRVIDYTDITIRTSDKYLKFVDNPDFNYSEKDLEEPVSFKDKLIYWILDFIHGIFQNDLSRIVLYILLAGLLLFVIFRLAGYRYSGLYIRNRKIGNAGDEVYDEDIYQTDFDKEVKKALSKGDYRLAVRYRYLHVLKAFAEADIIDWQAHKTNREYQTEISNKGYGKAFVNITRVYEYLWYGDFNITENRFIAFDKDFSNLYTNITGRRR